MMDAQTVSKQFYGTIDRSYNEVHRLALVRHYFTIKAEEEKKGTWTSLAIKKRDPTILLKTILRFREDFPDLMWYPGDASLKKFIDAVKANKPYYDRRKDSIGTVRRVRTEENWKRIETLLDSDKNISMSEITRITGISYETVRKMMAEHGVKRDNFLSTPKSGLCVRCQEHQTKVRSEFQKHAMAKWKQRRAGLPPIPRPKRRKKKPEVVTDGDSSRRPLDTIQQTIINDERTETCSAIEQLEKATSSPVSLLPEAGQNDEVCTGDKPLNCDIPELIEMTPSLGKLNEVNNVQTSTPAHTTISASTEKWYPCQTETVLVPKKTARETVTELKKQLSVIRQQAKDKAVMSISRKDEEAGKVPTKRRKVERKPTENERDKDEIQKELQNLFKVNSKPKVVHLSPKPVVKTPLAIKIVGAGDPIKKLLSKPRTVLKPAPEAIRKQLQEMLKTCGKSDANSGSVKTSKTIKIVKVSQTGKILGVKVIQAKSASGPTTINPKPSSINENDAPRQTNEEAGHSIPQKGIENDLSRSETTIEIAMSPDPENDNACD